MTRFALPQNCYWTNRLNGYRLSRFLFSFVLVVSLFIPCAPSPAAGAITKDNGSKKSENKELMTSLQGLPESKFSDDMIDGASFIEKMTAAADSYQDYSFDYIMKVFKDKKTVLEKGVLYYKKPGMMRLEETGDYKHGAVAALGPNNKVQAHLGGGLKLFVVELPPNSNLLRSANGYPMVDSDFKSLGQALKKFLKEGYKSLVTKTAVEMRGQTDNVFILELHKGSIDGPLWKRVAVNGRTHLPVEWWDYSDDGTLWSHATWDNFKPNQNLPDHIFSLKGGDNQAKVADKTKAS